MALATIADLRSTGFAGLPPLATLLMFEGRPDRIL